ncbi:hypothetical protein OEG84_06560 [Hoeflea sp. G2-23]|uniref:Uncharacterized protein n=1 Tax=Hoeflea algicola TaxID=2983763 RepID=A0ABT3Z6I8_9HYPH|nr:hypothetical protein [Hoeflea algicola]MCY0147380.1 hypothetical protein [Hoeflea algicola]
MPQRSPAGLGAHLSDSGNRSMALLSNGRKIQTSTLGKTADLAPFVNIISLAIRARAAAQIPAFEQLAG